MKKSKEMRRDGIETNKEERTSCERLKVMSEGGVGKNDKGVGRVEVKERRGGS